MLRVGVFSVAMLSGIVLASSESQISGSVHVSGSVIDKGCDIAGDGSSLSVDLGRIDVSALSGAAGVTAGAGSIEIPLINCPAMIGGVGVVFDGAADLTDTRLLSLRGTTAAEGVGIAFYEVDGTTQIPLYRQSELHPFAEGQVDMLLRYILKFKSTSINVVAGTAEASANFTLTYN